MVGRLDGFLCLATALGCGLQATEQGEKGLTFAELKGQALREIASVKEGPLFELWAASGEQAAQTRLALLGVEMPFRRSGYDRWALTGVPRRNAWRAAIAGLESDPHGVIELADGEARELAAKLFCDIDLRVLLRLESLFDWELELEELGRGRALLCTGGLGFAVPSDRERQRIALRVDLAFDRARRLERALVDLSLEFAAEPGEGERRVRSRLLALHPGANFEPAMTEIVAEIVAEIERLTRVRFADLELESLTEYRQEDVGRRRFQRAEAAVMLPSLRRLLPDFPEGLDPPPEIVELSTPRRYALALRGCIEGLSHDPLQDELSYLAGHAALALHGAREGAVWFERFLALHGIRSDRGETFWNRDLSARERRALAIVLEARER